MNINKFLSRRLSIDISVSQQLIKLLEDGATIPFIARYRKEQTRGLDEVALTEFHRLWTGMLQIEKRKETILKILAEQGNLSPEIEQKIKQCTDELLLEDIYLPFKTKRSTKAEVAKEAGLEPLAKIIMSQPLDGLNSRVSRFVKNYVKTAEQALEGARNIIAQWINENNKTRDFLRTRFVKTARIKTNVVKGKEQEAEKYKDYFAFEEKINRSPSHRLLAIFRGETQKLIRVKIVLEGEEDVLDNITRFYVRNNSESGNQVRLAVKDAYKRLLTPSLESEYRVQIRKKAEKEAILVFAKNLRNLLLEAPLGAKRLLAMDPGFRSGCKVVCLDEQGDLLSFETIFPHPPQVLKEQASEIIKSLVNKYSIQGIAIGNGTAGRETEAFIKELNLKCAIYMVSEDGASIYSASEKAREEFPSLDLTYRGSVSIGRRLSDPLAELIKIDPKSLGIGQYQYDVDQKLLKQELDWVVESCVNSVGVHLNTASKYLLTYVSGIGAKTAEQIVAYRKNNGPFSSRESIKKVKGLGPKAFEQAAGFLRITNGTMPLDNTAIHPESYTLVKKMAKKQHCNLEDLIGNKDQLDAIKASELIDDSNSEFAIKEILKELAKPPRDPRSVRQEFSFHKDIKKMEDLRVGMELPGIVGNVTNFGAFIDIGIKENGLIHISNMSDNYVANPSEILSLKQHVSVKVLEIDQDRKRIQLKLEEKF